jgi:hypothetical protein
MTAAAMPADQEWELEYIRKTYGVPARVGQRVSYASPGKAIRKGVIEGVSGAYLRIRYDGEEGYCGLHHPTWCLTYFTGEVQP